MRSLPPHLEESEVLIECLRFPCVIAIVETWLTDSNKELYSLKGYKHIHKIQPGRAGGGVSFYILEKHSFMEYMLPLAR